MQPPLFSSESEPTKPQATNYREFIEIQKKQTAERDNRWIWLASFIALVQKKDLDATETATVKIPENKILSFFLFAFFRDVLDSFISLLKDYTKEVSGGHCSNLRI